MTVLRADMARIANSYDLIWCAGAVYFLGVTEALSAWRRALNPGGSSPFPRPAGAQTAHHPAPPRFGAVHLP